MKRKRDEVIAVPKWLVLMVIFLLLALSLGLVISLATRPVLVDEAVKFCAMLGGAPGDYWWTNCIETWKVSWP